jgi:hypothetical protein
VFLPGFDINIRVTRDFFHLIGSLLVVSVNAQADEQAVTMIPIVACVNIHWVMLFLIIAFSFGLTILYIGLIEDLIE